jgi:hypothetical protein
MSTITTRSGKGSPLTHDEVDSNFTDLNTDKYQSGDSPSFVNVTVSGTVDGRDVATDGTKLDGIETAADVTDATNVTAAGALMDSELTSIASVKALNQGVATTDSPSFAGLTVASDSTYAIDVSRPSAGNTTLRITGGSTAGNDAVLRADIANTTGTSAVYFGDTDTNGIGRIMYEHNGDYMRFYTSSTEKMRIDSTGNVGIGTTSPTQKLEVSGTDARIYLTGVNTNIDMTATADGQLSLDGNGYAFGIALNANGANLYTNSVSRDLIFGVNETEVMRVTDSNVGIGTSSPAMKLDISGTSHGGVYIKSTSTNYSGIALENTNSATKWQIGVEGGTYNTAGKLNIGIDAVGPAIIIDSSRNVGIGTSSPASILEVSATEPYITISSTASQTGNALGGIRFDTADPSYGAGGYPAYITAQDISANGSAFGLVFGTQNAERMRINHLGNVGIGTSSPATKLHVLSGTNAGISVNDGTVNTILYNTSSANGSLGTTTNHPMAFYANNAERMRITAAGNVGIGTSTLNGTLLVINQSGEDAPSSSGNMNTGSFLGAVSAGGAALNIGHDADGTWYNSAYFNNAGVARIHRWLTGGTERMRIDGSGNVLVGKTVTSYTTPGVRLAGQGYASNFAHNTAGQTNVLFSAPVSQAQVNFYRQDTGAGMGSITNGATNSVSYNTSSDYRLKEDWQPMSGSVDRVKALKPVNFAWKLDGSRVDGFLAHEAQAIVPEAVTGTKDAVDAEGKPDYQGIDQSKLVPLLTAALQEALAAIESLTARVSALEGN